MLLPIDCVGYMERAKKGMRLDSIEYDENVGAVVGQLVAGSDKKLPSLHDGDSVPAVERAFLSFLAYYAEFARNSVKGPEIVAAACAFANSAGVSPPEIPLPLVKALERRQKTKRP